MNPVSCNLCARHCNIIRPVSAYEQQSKYGICHSAMNPMVARAALHKWEEPCISGTNGSGAIFFSGCNLKCVFCQNYEISSCNKGKEISVQRLKEIYQELIRQGAHNINLVTPTHFIPAILESLSDPISVPVVYNTNSYEDISALRSLNGKIQIYLPDLKYSDNYLAERYSKAPDYFETATKSILEMYHQTGDYQMNEQTGLMKSGVIIRHLILPGNIDNSYRIIDWVKDTFHPGQVLFSLMRQYIPCGQQSKFPEINRIVSDEEYDAIENYLFDSGIEDGFVQEKGASTKDFIPEFDCSGV